MTLNGEIPIIKFSKLKSEWSPKQHILVFISVYTPGSGSVFVYVLKFLPSDPLGGTFLYQSYFEVCEVDVVCLNCSGMHG